jgi:NADPH:quinone reductase-like Zn-dependent oxidoreductase
MQAVTYDPQRDAWQLRELPRPRPGGHDVLIRAQACGLNPVDGSRSSSN